MKWMIDRFEGSFAVVELPDRTMLNIPRSALPDGILEGDVLSVEADDTETEKRRKHIKGLMDDLFE